MQGWIKLYRELLNKPIWLCSTPEQKSILITLLLSANHNEKEWIWQGKKYLCKPGQLITSLNSLAEASGTSIRNVRTALKNFEQIYDFLTSEPTNKNTLITILNFEMYQSNINEVTSTLASNRQATDKQVTTNKNDKKKNNNKEVIYTVEQFEILQYWNSKNITTHLQTTNLQKAIQNALKQYDKQQILTAIDNYVEIYNSDYFYSHAWFLDKFLKQKNGLPEFLENGAQLQSYRKYKSMPHQGKGSKIMPQTNFEQRKYTKEQLNELYEA